MRGTSRLSVDPRIIVRLEKPVDNSECLNLTFNIIFEKARNLKVIDRMPITMEWKPCPTREPWDVKPYAKPVPSSRKK